MVVKYFIRRSGQTNDADKMLDHLNEEVEKFAKSKIASGANLKEKAENFRETRVGLPKNWGMQND